MSQREDDDDGFVTVQSKKDKKNQNQNRNQRPPNNPYNNPHFQNIKSPQRVQSSPNRPQNTQQNTQPRFQNQPQQQFSRDSNAKPFLSKEDRERTNAKIYAAGAIPIGPTATINLIIQRANEVLEQRWKRAAETHEKMKKLPRAEEVLENLKRSEGKEGKEFKKVPKKIRLNMYHEVGADLRLLEAVEHIQYYAIPIETSPTDFIATIGEDMKKKIRDTTEASLVGSAYADIPKSSYDLIYCHPSLQLTYENFLKAIGHIKDLSYIVGLEPISINSLYCGYGTSATLCLFAGSSSHPGEDPVKIAVNEVRQESSIDYVECFSKDYQIEQRKNLIKSYFHLYGDVEGMRVFFLFVGKDIQIRKFNDDTLKVVVAGMEDASQQLNSLAIDKKPNEGKKEPDSPQKQ